MAAPLWPTSSSSSSPEDNASSDKRQAVVSLNDTVCTGHISSRHPPAGERERAHEQSGAKVDLYIALSPVVVVVCTGLIRLRRLRSNNAIENPISGVAPETPRHRHRHQQTNQPTNHHHHKLSIICARYKMKYCVRVCACVTFFNVSFLCARASERVQ